MFLVDKMFRKCDSARMKQATTLHLLCAIIMCQSVCTYGVHNLTTSQCAELLIELTS